MTSAKYTARRNRYGTAFVSTTLLASLVLAYSQAWEMSVCADPSTMPFSSQEQTGFENRIAEILSEELGASLNYVWWPQGQTMVSRKLREGECDIIMGIPDGQSGLLSTVAYYRSTHVFVYRSDAPFDITSLDDEALKELRIGVQHTGIAPHEALLNRGLARNVVFQGGERGYGEQGVHRFSAIIEAVTDGTVDVALAWGPVAGYYAEREDVELKVVPVQPEIEPPFLSMVLSMTIGVRQGDEALRDRLNTALSVRWDEIQAVLAEYHVPHGQLPRPAGRARAPVSTDDPLRVGLVVPTLTGVDAVRASLFDLTGEAATMGARMAEDSLNNNTGRGAESSIELLLASSPSVDAALRAGQRLVTLEEVDVLVGGLGRSQAEKLAQIAVDGEVLFFNIGSPSSELRSSCNRHAFHLEASERMYLAALIEWFSLQGHLRWFIIHEATEQGESLARSATGFVDRYSTSGVVVGTSQVAPGQPNYTTELRSVAASNADVVLLLLSAEDQIPFLAQQTSFGIEVAIAPFPDPVSQTRDYVAAAWSRSQNSGLQYRVQLWEATLESAAAAELNTRFTSRWGKPLESAAWAAYHAITIFHQAVEAVGNSESAALIEYLESPGTAFDVAKGVNVRFRNWDHQLLQPLYVIEIDHQAQWSNRLTHQLSVAQLADVLQLDRPIGAGQAGRPNRRGEEAEPVDCGW